MLEEPTRSQAPNDEHGTRTFGVSGGTASFPANGQSFEPLELPAVPGFEVLEPVGRGGMGLVFKARQLATGRIVALKMILAGELANTAARDRFRSEITATAKLSHPHIVQLFEAGEADGRAFLVCEYVGGGSLAARLDGTPWDAKRAARMIVPIARAVALAHRTGIVHRDLKPANILLDSAFAPKLADFGIAKQIGEAADSGTHTGAILGTPSYMAPEQAGGARNAGPAADVYGLGAILYELITGRPPFKGADFVETLDQVRRQEPVAPRILQPKLPRDIETICLKCLQKDPARRYGSADELADDLERFLEGKPIAARPVGSAERAWRWAKRNPPVSGLLAAVLIVSVTGAVIATVYADEASEFARIANKNAGDAERREKEANAARAELALEADKLRKEQDLTRRLLYISQMNAASVALSEGRIPRLVQILEETMPKPGEPDLRGWEWHYFDRLTRPQGPAIRFASPGDPSFVPADSGEAFRMNLGWVASIDFRRFLRASLEEKQPFLRFEVWDVAKGKRLDTKYTLADGKPIPADVTRGQILSAVFSRDGREFAAFYQVPSPDGEGSFQPGIWEVESGRHQPLPASPLSTRFMAAREAAIVGFDESRLMWLENESLPPIFGFGFPARVLSRGFPLERTTSLVPWQSQAWTLVQWDRRTGQIARKYFTPKSNDRMNTYPVLSSPSGFAVFQVFGSGSAPGQRALKYECWDFRSGEPKRLVEVELPQAAYVAVSPGGSYFATLAGSTLTLVPTSSPGPVTPVRHTVEGPTESLRLTAVSDAGVAVLQRPNLLTTVDLKAPAPVTQLYHHRDGVVPLAEMAPGRGLVSFGGDGPVLREWPVRKLAVDSRTQPFMGATETRRSPNGRWELQFKRIATETAVVVRDAATQKTRARLELPPTSRVLLADFLPGDRERILVNAMELDKAGLDLRGDTRTSWHLFDLEGRRLAGEKSRSKVLMSPATVSKSGRRILSGYFADEVAVHDGTTGALVNRFPVPNGFSVQAISLDYAEERLLIGASPQPVDRGGSEGAGRKAESGWIQLFEVESGRALWPQPARPEGLLEPVGPELQVDRTARVEFLEKENRVLVGSTNTGQAVVCDFQTRDGAVLRRYAGPESEAQQSVYLSPQVFFLDGDRRMLAIAGRKEVLVWDLTTGEKLAKLEGHDSPVFDAAFSTDRRRIFTMESAGRPGSNLFAGFGLRILVWDVATSRPIATLRAQSVPSNYGGTPVFGIRFEKDKLHFEGQFAIEPLDGTPVK